MASVADFGTEISCVTDIAPDGRIVSGNTVVAEAVARRLRTPRGRLIDDPNYGFDVAGYLADDMSASDLAALQSGIIAECLKDERIQAATAAVDLTLGALTVKINLTTSVLGPFRLTLSVSATTFNILAVT